jgi:CRP/FNR family transcriptional regulator, cyclic AMP receptor protein
MSLMSLLEEAGVKENVPWVTKMYKAGELIVEEESPGCELFLITSGQVNVLTNLQITPDHQENKGIARLSAEDFFGEIGLFSEELRSASVAAATDCEIAIVDGAALLDYMDLNPDKGYPIMRFLFETLVGRMRNNNIRANAIMGFYLREAGG